MADLGSQLAHWNGFTDIEHSKSLVFIHTRKDFLISAQAEIAHRDLNWMQHTAKVHALDESNKISLIDFFAVCRAANTKNPGADQTKPDQEN